MNKAPLAKTSLITMLLCCFSFSSHATQKVIWAHVYETSEPMHRWAEWAANEVTRRSHGRFDVQVYPASALGKEAYLNQSLSLGVIDLIYTGQSFAAQTYAPIALSDFPYIFRDFDHWQKFIRSDLFQDLSDGYSEASAGNVIVANHYYGQRHVTSNKPITQPEHMQGLKIRVPNAALFKMFPESVDAHPTPIAFSEVYLALQQGVVDAQENPLPTIKAKKFYEVQKYISLTGHLFGSNLIVASGTFWQALPGSDKALFRQVLEEAATKITLDIQLAEEQLASWFTEQGIEVIEVNREAFRELAISSYIDTLSEENRLNYQRLQSIP